MFEKCPVWTPGENIQPSSGESITMKAYHKDLQNPGTIGIHWQGHSQGLGTLYQGQALLLKLGEPLFISHELPPRSAEVGWGMVSSLQPSFLLKFSLYNLDTNSPPLSPMLRHYSIQHSSHSNQSLFPFQWGHSHQHPNVDGVCILK